MKPRKDIWVPKQGAPLPVCDMTCSHIENAIAMLIRDVMTGGKSDLDAFYREGSEAQGKARARRVKRAQKWISIFQHELAYREWEAMRALDRSEKPWWME